MSRKIILVSLLAAFVVGLIGCSSGNKSNNNSGASSPANEAENITLSVTSYLNSEERIKMMDETIAIFNKEHPNVKINHSADGGNYEQSLKLAFSSGEGQDIVYVDDAKQQLLQKNNYLMDITEDVKSRGWLDQQVSGAIEYNNLRTPDSYYSVPFLMAPVVVFYNKQIFEELQLTPPTNIAEFNTILEKAKSAGKIPMENAGLNNFNLMWSFFSLLYGQVDMKDVNDFYYLKDVTKPLEDAMISSLTTLNDWVNKGYYRKDMSSIDYNAIPTVFAKGESAMVVDGDWNLPAYKDLDFPVGVFAFPVTDSSLPNTIVNATDGAWALNAELTPAKKQAALDFIEVFMEPEVVKIWSEGGLTSSITVDSSSFSLPPLKQELNEAISTTNIGFYLDGALPGFTDVVVKETQKMMLKESTPEECWNNIKTEYEKLKAQALAN
jgi:ABC-type glycerol-3-phosphate transport system substrate-binding protein